MEKTELRQIIISATNLINYGESLTPDLLTKSEESCMNTFLETLRANAKNALDKLDKDKDVSMATTKQKEAKANKSVNTPDKLLKRFKDNIKLMNDAYQDRFTPFEDCIFEFDTKRLYCTDRTMYIRWQTRKHPYAEESYQNQQTTIGVIIPYTNDKGKHLK